jgi:replicative DNA helicase
LKNIFALVKDKFIRRSLIKLGYEAINSGYITNISLEKLLNDFENKLFNLTMKLKSKII